MATLSFILLIILIVIIVSMKGSLVNQISILTKKVEILQRQLQSLNEKLDKKPSEKVEISIQPIKEPEKTYVYEEKVQKDIKSDSEKIKIEEKIVEPIREKPPISKPSIVQQKRVKPTFFERNPDLEKFIGENLINKIGIAILVLGIAFFVKYAISKDWINEIGRTAIGVFCGGLLIALAHKLRNSFAAFSSVLVGGGIAVLYFTFTIAFHQYHIFSQSITFIIMVIITAFSVLLSVSYDRKELAILALIGGFASPFLVSTGSGNYVTLFTYVTILNTGMLVLAYFKKWNTINVLAYVFTILLFGGWVYSKILWAKNPPYTGAFIFATIFYSLFFLMNIVFNLKEKRKFSGIEISILLSNTFLYFSVGIFILNHFNHGAYNGLFTLLIAFFNLIFAYTLYKKDGIDKTLVYLLIGVVLTFVSLTAPIQLEGNYITLFWAAETVLLLWLYQKSQIKLMFHSSIILMVLMFISLFMDWSNIYFAYTRIELNIVLNKAFITGLFSIASVIGTLILLRKEENEFSVLNSYKKLMNIALIVVTYLVLLFELRHQLQSHVVFYAAKEIIFGCYNFATLIILNLVARKKINIPAFLEIAVFLGLFVVFSYPFFYHQMVIDLRTEYLTSGNVGFSAYLFHYIDVILVFYLIYLIFKNSKINEFTVKELDYVIVWLISGITIFITSAELDHIIVMSNVGPDSKLTINQVLNQSHKIGFPILWGVYSFVMMFIGMRFKRRDLRIISLSLFLVIIIKLFTFDIKGISEGGKIAAFIFLGIILLVVSFMYQKLKQLVLEGDSKLNQKENEL